MSNESHFAVSGWTTDGHWWIGNNEEQRVPGQLVYSPDKPTRLYLNGSFSDVKEALAQSAGTIPFINGITRDGKLACLTGCMLGPSSMRSPGYYSQEYYINAVLVGMNAQTSEDLVFEWAYYDLDNLWTWLSQSAFASEIEHDIETNRIKQYTVTYKDPKFKVYKIGDVEMSFYPTHIINDPHASNESRIEAGISVGYKLPKPMAPSKITNTYGMYFEELLTLATSKHCKIRKIHFQSDRHRMVIDGKKSEYKEVIRCLIPQVSGEIDVDETSAFYLFSFKDVEDAADDIFQKWFVKRERISPVYHLYFHVMRQKMLIQHAFLSLVNCAEVFHRRVMQVVDKEKFEKRMRSIQGKVNSDEWSWLSGRLAYAYEPGLKKRLAEIWDRMPESVKRVVGERDSFCHEVHMARNYLTHFDSRLEASFQLHKLNDYIAKLRMQIRVLLLQEIGLSDEHILNAIRKSNGFLYVPRTYMLE